MSEPRAVAIVPARLGSVRFPGKLLKDDTGLPLVIHTARAAAAATCIDRVALATEDQEIQKAAHEHGFECVLTGAHDNGTSRLAEAAGLLGLDDDTIVVNMQGDEPELDPDAIDAAVHRLIEVDAPDVATLAAPIGSAAAFADPNVVKVAMTDTRRALYFSRAPVPHDRDGRGYAHAYRHVGLYVYRVSYLKRYAGLPATALETIERLEQLRVLDSGGTIGVALVDAAHEGIDTEAQYRAFVDRWRAQHGG